MSWENYGNRGKDRGWHLDHINPLCLMDVDSETDLKIFNSYKNLRPLWAEENEEKSKEDLIKLVARKKEDK